MSTKTHSKDYEFQRFASEFQNRMRNIYFCNVPMVSEDNQKFQAHKVILAVHSSVVKKHPHPITFMRGVGNEVFGLGLHLQVH